MPKLRTNRARTIVGLPAAPKNACTASYEEYVGQREVQTNVSSENVEALTESYRLKVSEPLKSVNPDIEMGEYFVIPVSELKEMLNADQNAEFIHVCNALRDVQNSNGEVKTFPVAIIVPFQKATVNNKSVFEACKSDNSLYIEAYPCPPDPRCPIGPGPAGVNAFENIFKANTKFNQFNTLF